MIEIKDLEKRRENLANTLHANEQILKDMKMKQTSLKDEITYLRGAIIELNCLIGDNPL